MNLVDILLVLIVLVSVWAGWYKGFVLGILDLASLGVGIIVTFFLYPYLAAFFVKHITSLGAWTLPVSFLITYIIVRVLLNVVMNLALRDIPAETHRSNVNRFLGIIPGFGNGLIYATVIAALLLAIPFDDGISAKTRNSAIAEKLTVPATWLEEKLSPVFDEAVNQTMNSLTVKPGSEEFVKLPYTVTGGSTRENLEVEMLSLVNGERLKAGLKTLKADAELTVVARNHSKDMFARGYFSHFTPDSIGPFDRMRSAGVKFSHAGENLALAQTLALAHNGLMNSPGHRANILRPQFGRVGIGIIDGGKYGLMISQEFRN